MPTFRDAVDVAVKVGEDEELAAAINDLLRSLANGVGSERLWVLTSPTAVMEKPHP